MKYKSLDKNKLKQILGWIGVSITLIVSSIWAFWGTIENFHEGWYSESLLENLFIFFIQYGLFFLIFSGFSIISVLWSKVGALLFIIVGVFAWWFFAGASFSVVGVLIVIPIFALALLYYVGRPKRKRTAIVLIIIVPLVISIIVGVPNLIKVLQRQSDEDFGMRYVQGNGVSLYWAPRGEGWPDKGKSWYEAIEACDHLSEDGSTIFETEQNIWRLPTVDEAVRSQALHGENSGGVWDADTKQATYEKKPDKETPLWDIHSQIIYLWTSDEYDEMDAYIFAYNGGIWTRMKESSPGYLSFRCVK
jgi:hypothetical protein